MEFESLPKKGRFFQPHRKRNKQIKKLNTLVENLQQSTKRSSNTGTVRACYAQLCTYYWELMSKGGATKPIREWFRKNPLYSIEQWIAREATREQFRAKLKPVLSKPEILENLYHNYEGKSGFGSQLCEVLNTHLIANKRWDTKYTAEDLSGSNNPVVKVKKNNDHFICRLFRVNADEDELSSSARLAREALETIDYVVPPYALCLLENDGQEKVYLEFTEYFKHGNLEDFFKHLHEKLNNDEENLEIEMIQKLALTCFRELSQFYCKLNEQNAWYSDLKPSNILLSNDGKLRISDAKGFLLSKEALVPTYETNTTQQYHQSSAFHHKFLNLEVLERQNLACTLYQLLSNRLPEQVYDSTASVRAWETKFDFSHPIFSTGLGPDLREMIEDLYRPNFRPFSDYLQNCHEKFATEFIEIEPYLYNPGAQTKAENPSVKPS